VAKVQEMMQVCAHSHTHTHSLSLTHTHTGSPVPGGGRANEGSDDEGVN
jgi:hypothetical protein